MQPIELLERVNRVILNPTIELIFGVAVVVFLWGMVQFMMNSDSDTGRSDGRKNILWGLVGMLIMVSVYGIIRVALNTFGIDTGGLFIFR